MNCIDATRLLSEAQERTLAKGERLRLGIHLAMCGGCRRFARQLPALRRFARAYARGEHERSGRTGPDA
ncbi:MAG: hypothetical protein KatS3mg124_2285 [Porticoccaceae bacterium]|nr:MAG: hypothetical protein KatS3mg124_2285 [Porticoccaceae bacterium]